MLQNPWPGWGLCCHYWSSIILYRIFSHCHPEVLYCHTALTALWQNEQKLYWMCLPAAVNICTFSRPFFRKQFSSWLIKEQQRRWSVDAERSEGVAIKSCLLANDLSFESFSCYSKCHVYAFASAEMFFRSERGISRLSRGAWFWLV